MANDWGTRQYLAQNINNSQAAAVKVGGGSGVLLNNKYVLTAAHVPLHYSDVDWKTQVTNIWGESSGISNIWYDVQRDLAVIELSSPFKNYYGVQIGSSEPTKGQLVYQVGHPSNVAMGNKGWAVTFGTAMGQTKDQYYSMYDIDSYGGYSGGGVFNERGELIGIVSGSNSAFNAPVPWYKDKPIHNQVLDRNNDWNGINVNSSTIKEFLAKNNIPVTSGGNNVLPVNKIDTYAQFVTTAEASEIQKISAATVDSAVGIFNASANGDTTLSSSLRGSGTLVGDRLVLTNTHVIFDRNEVKVGFKGGEVIKGKIIATHETMDLAMVLLDTAAPVQYDRAVIASSGISSNEAGFIIGNPGDLWRSEGGWHVSAIKGYKDDKGDEIVNGSTLPGNSGSGVYDMKGDLASVMWGSSNSGQWAQHGTLIDRQDPHTTMHNPSADPSFSGTATINHALVEEFVTRFGGDARNNGSYTYDSVSYGDSVYTVGREYANGVSKAVIGRIKSNGQYDTSFGGDGKLHLSANKGDVTGASIAIDQTGHVVVLANYLNEGKSTGVLFKINQGQRIEGGFGNNGFITDFGSNYFTAKSLAVDDQGRVIVIGDTMSSSSDIQISRYTSDGKLDKTFGSEGWVKIDTSGNDYAAKVAVHNGQIYFGGYTNTAGKEMDFLVGKLTANGQRDTSYGINGVSITPIIEKEQLIDMAIQQDGKLVATGLLISERGDYDSVVIRYNQNGQLDSSFGQTGIVRLVDASVNEYSTSVAVSSDGKIVITGYTYVSKSGIDRSSNGDFDQFVLRVNQNGQIDSSFGQAGKMTKDFGGDDFGQSVSLLGNQITTVGYNHLGDVSQSSIWSL